LPLCFLEENYSDDNISNLPNTDYERHGQIDKLTDEWMDTKVCTALAYNTSNANKYKS